MRWLESGAGNTVVFVHGISTSPSWGAADGFQKIHYGERLAGDLRARLDVISDGKHFVPEDHPDAVATAVASVTERASL